MNMVSKSRKPRGDAREIVAAAAKAGRVGLPAFLLAVTLGACASTFSSLPTQLGGMPADAPQQPAAPAAYPAVHDMPPPRPDVVMTQDEQKKAEAELMALRERQEREAGTFPNTPPKAAPNKAAKTTPKPAPKTAPKTAPKPPPEPLNLAAKPNRDQNADQNTDQKDQ
jgi:hypothetical protein